MRRVSYIIGVVLIFLLSVIAFDLLLQFVWNLVGGRESTVPNWVRYMADPTFGMFLACVWVLTTSGILRGPRRMRVAD